MKFDTVFVLLNLAAVQATALPAALPELEAPFVGFAVPKMITPKYRSTAKRAIIRYPAFTLAAKGAGSGFSLDSNGQGGTLRVGQGMCSRCTILSGHYRLVYANGTEATPEDGVYIHHMLSFLSPKTSSNVIGGMSSGTVLGGMGGAYFVGRGEDSGQTDTVFTSIDGKYDSGYHVNSPPSVMVSYDLVNYQNTPKQLHLELEYEWVDGIVGQDAGHSLKSVAGVPRTQGKSVSLPMPVSKTSTIMWARGHLHSGGASMTLKVNGAVKCVSEPTYDSNGVIVKMSHCPEAIQLKAGDSITIESVYDTTKHKLRPSTDGSGHAAHGRLGGSDVMGMFAMSYTT